MIPLLVVYVLSLLISLPPMVGLGGLGKEEYKLDITEIKRSKTLSSKSSIVRRRWGRKRIRVAKESRFVKTL